MTDLVTIVLLAAHLLGMNVASAGPALSVALLRYGRRHPEREQDALDLARRMAQWSCYLLLLAIVLGIVLGGTKWALGDGRFIGVIPLFGRKVIWGTLEILCSLLWMGGYWWWLSKKPPEKSWTRLIHTSLALLSVTNLLYHFPPLLTVMVQAASGELNISEPVDAKTFRALSYTPQVMAQSMHFWWASFAVSGTFIFWLARRVPDAGDFLRLGARWSLVATLLQIPTGFWLLIASPPLSQSRLMGGSKSATILFVCSLGCVFLLLSSLASLAIGTPDRVQARRAGWWMTGTVLLMTGALHFMRN